MREWERERMWDMKGSPSEYSAGNDRDIHVKKVPEAKEEPFKKIWCNAWCSHGTSNCIPSPQTDWTTPHSLGPLERTFRKLLLHYWE